ncbi:uncharacterized protein LOC133521950 [Cydia pomonella]|uniref:uncharacterized protein LOC133521950 n=1 Tax=Cydia pomonella TaxID=82600 RepID=UPI002ADE87D2|nr:uncharacterized protein LOC133521950 [Cydia pomonella]
MSNSPSNVFDGQDYTFKQYYYPVSDAEDSLTCVPDEPVKRKLNTHSNIDAFFDQPKIKRKKNVSSTVGKGCKGGGISYISTNKDDGTNSTHLIKIEIFDMKKLSKVSDTTKHWMFADVRAKYFVMENETNKHLQQAKDLIYGITKEISESNECKKYHFNSKV